MQYYINSSFLKKRKVSALGFNLFIYIVAHLNEHFDACYSLEGQQQKGHERQPLALRRLLQTSDDSSKLHVGLPVDRHT